MPFRNLKFLIMLNKAFGLVSCKLVNGQLRSNSIWSSCFCVIWLLFHCLYTGAYYYMEYTTLQEEKKFFALSILRFSVFTVSILPYNVVAAFWSEDIVKLSDKLLAYDEQAVTLGYPRKDKHVLINLFFVYTSVVMSWSLYNNVRDYISGGIWEIITVLQIIIPIVTGTSCVLLSCMFLDLIRQRFRHLNEMIVPHISQLPVTGSQGEITVYDVRHLHRMLLNGAEIINTLYGFGTLFVFLSILLESVSTIYLFIRNIQNGTLDLLNLLFQTIYLSSMYHVTAYEANRVEEGVIKYGLPFSSEKCRMDKTEMMLYFYHRRYTFTAAGFFPVNLTMLLSVATMVTTFVTLMI